MKKSPIPYWLAFSLTALLVILVAGLASGRATMSALANDSAVEGPVVGELVYPAEFNGDLRDLAQIPQEPDTYVPLPFRYTPGTEPKGSAPQLAGWLDPVAQTAFGAGQMPNPLISFSGMSLAAGGAGWPPDTNGDVGPNHYIQTVNTSIAIYDKSTGAEITRFTFNTFFNGTGTPCDAQNGGDPVVVYDRLADRWLITDFAIPGPYYECVAVSKTGDPVNGGWWQYGVLINNTQLNDYPKVGVWPDGYYISFNMFTLPSSWEGVQVWALDRAAMLDGNPMQTVHFSLDETTGYGSLLPSHLLTDPPAGSPNYFTSVAPLNELQIWEFDVDWATPANSTFTGPTILDVADFAIAASVPQQGTSTLLDSLSFRPMMQNSYREINGVESLWFNHTVAASDGYAGVRWYEVQDPGGTPTVTQQGTYQPDANHYWMGSVSVDQDGNMAAGYSVSDTNMYPSIRYSGRLYGETPGLLPQGEAVLINGSGSQSGINRWGDYSHMTVDPTDDCTFWYTTEYYTATGTNWQTRIGSFKFPSCGQPKAYLDGTVYNAVTLESVPNVNVVAHSANQTFTAITDANGHYHIIITADTFDLTAGPLLPGYPNTNTIAGVVATTGNTTLTDIPLTPAPFLVEDGNTIDDNVPFGNNNGFPEPGEQGLLLSESLFNSGAVTATNVMATITSLTAGVTVDVAEASYPDIPAGAALTNETPFSFSIDQGLACGTVLDFQKNVISDQGSWDIDFSLTAAIPQSRADIFANDVENGAQGWTTGGTLNTWAITTIDSHSPTHSWTDSPAGNYADNTNSYVRTPAYDLTGKRGVRLTGWFKWALEAGYDYVYVEYSLNGGTTWATTTPLYTFNGFEDWSQIPMEAPALDDQPNVALRFRLVSDGGVVEDGFFLDDIALSYQPYQCDYSGPLAPEAPTLVSPVNGGVENDNTVLFSWIPPVGGGAPAGYEIEVNSAVYTTTIPTTVLELTLPAGNHTWRVRAFNAAGFSAWTDSWVFSIPFRIFLPLNLNN